MLVSIVKFIIAEVRNFRFHGRLGYLEGKEGGLLVGIEGKRLTMQTYRDCQLCDDTGDTLIHHSGTFQLSPLHPDLGHLV